MQKEIQLTDKTLLLVGLKPNCTKVRHFETINELEIVYGDVIFGKEYKYIKLVGNYELLGIYPELTEEQSKSVVESYYGGTKFHNYIGDMMLDTAKESFQSLMEREKCYTVNPLKFDPTGITTGEWQEAQQTTFDKYAILIKEK